jgi:hypothetical protein
VYKTLQKKITLFTKLHIQTEADVFLSAKVSWLLRASFAADAPNFCCTANQHLGNFSYQVIMIYDVLQIEVHHSQQENFLSRL